MDIAVNTTVSLRSETAIPTHQHRKRRVGPAVELNRDVFSQTAEYERKSVGSAEKANP